MGTHWMVERNMGLLQRRRFCWSLFLLLFCFIFTIKARNCFSFRVKLLYNQCFNKHGSLKEILTFTKLSLLPKKKLYSIIVIPLINAFIISFLISRCQPWSSTFFWTHLISFPTFLPTLAFHILAAYYFIFAIEVSFLNSLIMQWNLITKQQTSTYQGTNVIAKGDKDRKKLFFPLLLHAFQSVARSSKKRKKKNN